MTFKLNIETINVKVCEYVRIYTYMYINMQYTHFLTLLTKRAGIQGQPSEYEHIYCSDLSF